jgi:hypothetical protein
MTLAEAPRLGVVDRDARAVGAGVMQAITMRPRCRLVLVLLHGALPAGADRAQRRVPAEVGQVEAEREAGVEQVLPVGSTS